MSGVAPDPAAISDLIARLRSYTDTGDNESIGQQYARLIAIVPAERVAAMARGGFSWITTDDEEAIDALLGNAADALEVLVARTTPPDDWQPGEYIAEWSDVIDGVRLGKLRQRGTDGWDVGAVCGGSSVAWLSDTELTARWVRLADVPGLSHAYGVTTEGEPPVSLADGMAAIRRAENAAHVNADHKLGTTEGEPE